jgi:hypothetical protein
VVGFGNVQDFSFPIIKRETRSHWCIIVTQVSGVCQGTGTAAPRPRRIGALEMGSKLC